RQQMQYFGPIISFTLADEAAAQHFLSACTLVYEATSFGSLHTTAERRARWGGDVVAAGFIRMNVGCEDVGDLMADLAQVLGN
ncbi:MAG: PLP-dependent transferase, partial [Chloroflexota bacterium]